MKKNPKSNKQLSGTYVVYSDIQGNFDYLERFSKAIENMKKNGVICLGDIVNNFSDYSDNRCIDLVRDITDICIKGNHGEKIIETTQEKITLDNIEFIKNLPKKLNLGNVLIVHSSMSKGKKRLDTLEKIQKEAEFIEKHYPNIKFMFFGHTHKKGAYKFAENQLSYLGENNIGLNTDELNLINPGGIGLSYGLEKSFVRVNLDTGALEFYTLEQAEELAKKADIVNIFDERWMPSINQDLYGWFTQYIKKDIPVLKSNDEKIDKLIERLNRFDKNFVDKVGVAKRKKYLDAYSLDLAEDVNLIRAEVQDFYYTKDPLESRKEFLNLKRKKY